MAEEPRAPVFRVGCPMWAHRPWVGRWYPEGTRSGSELALYAQLCNAVEGNTTFYGEPTARTVARWLELTPADFRFAFKVPRVITHDRRLYDVAGPVRSFLNRIEPLGDRVGTVQVQLPPTFGPESLEILLAFARRLPLDWPWAIELRNRAFFDGSAAHRRLDELLIERAIGRVVLDTRPLHAVEARSSAARDEKRNKPELPVLLDAVGSRPVVRVIGQDSPDGTYDGLRAWLPTIAAWITEGREPYVFVHQPENLDSPGLARRLHAELRQLLPAVAPLPEPVPVDVPEQTSMF